MQYIFVITVGMITVAVIRGPLLYVIAGIFYAFAMSHTFGLFCFVGIVSIILIEAGAWIARRIGYKFGGVIGRPLTVD